MYEGLCHIQKAAALISLTLNRKKHIDIITRAPRLGECSFEQRGHRAQQGAARAEGGGAPG